MRVDLDGFERRYASAPDPWGFADEHYEQRKYAITVASLPLPRYRRCFEPGCSIGALTEHLATVADVVIAQDASPTASNRAEERLSGSGHVDVRCGAIPEVWPDGLFDLIVFSELGYYWDAPELGAITGRLSTSLEPGGHLVAVHWLGDSADHLLGGQEVHSVVEATFGAPIVHHAEARFLLNVWLAP